MQSTYLYSNALKHNEGCRTNALILLIILIIVILSFFLVGKANGQSNDSNIIPKDKQLHAFCGAAIASWSYLVIDGYATKRWQPPILGMSSCILAGIAKESYDKLNGSSFDIKDLGATMAGGIISIGIIEGCRALVNHRRIVVQKQQTNKYFYYNQIQQEKKLQEYENNRRKPINNNKYMF